MGEVTEKRVGFSSVMALRTAATASSPGTRPSSPATSSVGRHLGRTSDDRITYHANNNGTAAAAKIAIAEQCSKMGRGTRLEIPVPGMQYGQSAAKCFPEFENGDYSRPDIGVFDVTQVSELKNVVASTARRCKSVDEVTFSTTARASACSSRPSERSYTRRRASASSAIMSRTGCSARPCILDLTYLE